ncbi:AraC family transcriptional regulator [Pseudomonas syringae group sp. J254-4]|uniref:AraC family transcriptional regulator n=1 Tax=Pseudomonas syringae group sp. J254-4 TaxID=3079589 RepID=UPI00290E7EEF|nr:AraC family transcriptional regulator [Pseudomonas syringae group sp. J254-4]MDU8459760.1 AraC family transcriptional regulator [Pseudomonas syringae group sp. J254-4]
MKSEAVLPNDSRAHGLHAAHHDLDGARAWMSTICGPHSLQASAPHCLEFEHSANVLSAMSTVLGRIQYGTDVVIGVEPGSSLKSYSISLPLDGEQELDCGKGLLRSNAGTGLIISPFDSQRLSITGNCRKLQVAIDCCSMQRVLDELLERPAQAPLVFEPCINAELGATASWWRMVRYLVDEMDGDSDYFEHLPMARDLERSLIKGLILSQPNNYSAALNEKVQSRCPAFLKRAQQFIEEHCGDDIHLIDIERAAGIGPQKLHDSFKTHFGVSPVVYLKRFRLQSARRSLLQGHSGYNIAAIASQWGFNHLGRFAQDYQRLFGELPSQTLERGSRH